MPAFDFLADPLFWIAALSALAAAAVRGFSGFGAGLIFMPVGAACLGPKTAAGVIYVIDTILILPFAVRAVRMVEWREIAPLGLGAVMTVPAGVAVLLIVDPVPLRWGLSLVILVSVGLLAAGWRYRGPTRVWLSLLVGAIAGFMSGSAQIPGPPVLIYWLGRRVVSATMRANAFIFFLFTTTISGVAFIAGGIFTAEVMALSLALFPVYAVGIFLGGRMFGLASEATYRQIAYATILFAAVVSMPVFE
ncbi:MAG: TSUP family transporter [Propylenella sp.]